MPKKAGEKGEKELLECGHQIQLIVARVNVEEADIDLSKYKVPEVSAEIEG